MSEVNTWNVYTAADIGRQWNWTGVLTFLSLCLMCGNLLRFRLQPGERPSRGNLSISAVMFEKTQIERGRSSPPMAQRRGRICGCGTSSQGTNTKLEVTVWGVNEDTDFLKGNLIKKQNKVKSSVKMENEWLSWVAHLGAKEKETLSMWKADILEDASFTFKRTHLSLWEILFFNLEVAFLIKLDLNLAYSSLMALEKRLWGMEKWNILDLLVKGCLLDPPPG